MGKDVTTRFSTFPHVMHTDLTPTAACGMLIAFVYPFVSRRLVVRAFLVARAAGLSHIWSGI